MLVYTVNKEKCKSFLNNHQSVQKSMVKFGNYSNFQGNRKGSLLMRYKKWLSWLELNRVKIADSTNTVNSPSFGKQTFYKMNWKGVTGWAELFQYLNPN